MLYRIGEVAEACGVNKETVRYYERQGLIPTPKKNASGYRMYDKNMVNRIKFIKRMQELGFRLREIHQLFGVVDRDQVRCQDMYNFTVHKIDDIRTKIRDLQRIEHMLLDLKARCPDNKDMYACPIIETLMDHSQQGI